MKFRSVLLSVSALALVASMTSCVRSYTCQCEISYTGQPGLPDTLVKEYPIKDTKKKAESTCEGNSGTYTRDGITTVENCHLY